MQTPEISPQNARRALAVALCAAVLGTALPAAAVKNVVPNGRFDGKVTPFTTVSGLGNFFYDPSEDVSGNDGSGSLLLGDDLVDPLPRVGVHACFPGAVPPGDYYFSFRYRFMPGEVANGNVRVTFTFLPSANCTGGGGMILPSQYGDTSQGRGVWHHGRSGHIAMPAGTVPPGMNSLVVTILVDRKSGPGALNASFDNLFFARVGKPLCRGLVPTIGGTDADDTIEGTSGPDVIVALGGDDIVLAGDSEDIVCGGPGKDAIWGEGGDDGLFGEGGDDTLNGGKDADVLKGGGGNDIMNGWTGFDYCIGGGGTGDSALGCEDATAIP